MVYRIRKHLAENIILYDFFGSLVLLLAAVTFITFYMFTYKP